MTFNMSTMKFSICRFTPVAPSALACFVSGSGQLSTPESPGQEGQERTFDLGASRARPFTGPRQAISHDYSSHEILIARLRWSDTGSPFLSPGPTRPAWRTERARGHDPHMRHPGLAIHSHDVRLPKSSGQAVSLDKEDVVATRQTFGRRRKGCPGTAERTCSMNTMKFSILQVTLFCPRSHPCFDTSRALDSF